MSKFVYPAIFSWSSEDCTYYVTFPDIESCFTDGDSIAEAMENASDALNLMLYYTEKTGEALPEPTPLEKVPVPANGFVNLVMADTAAYQEVIERENNPINYARKKAGMNIKQLAALLDAPYRTVQEWNAGRRMPPKWVQNLIVDKIQATV